MPTSVKLLLFSSISSLQVKKKKKKSVLQLNIVYVNQREGNTRSLKIHTFGCFYKCILKQLLLKTTV